MNMTPREASIEIELIAETIMALQSVQPKLVAQLFASLNRLQNEFVAPLHKQPKPRHPPSVPRIPPRRERAQTIIGIAPNVEPGRPLGRIE
jgi:hypothetical protein